MVVASREEDVRREATKTFISDPMEAKRGARSRTRKEREDALQQGTDDVLELALHLARAQSLRALYESLMERLTVEMLGAQDAMILEGDPHSDLMIVVATTAPEWLGRQFQRTERFERVLGGQIVALKNVSHAEEWASFEVLDGIARRAAIHIPLRSTTMVIGLHERAGFFTREHVMWSSKLAPLISQHLTRLMTHQFHLNELRRHQDQHVLREQFVLIKHAARALGAGVGVLDEQGNMVEVSDALAQLLEAWPDPHVWWSRVKRVLSQTPISGSRAPGQGGERVETKRTADVCTPQGARRVFELTFTGRPMHIEQGRTGHVLLVSDVTRWIEAEDALIEARDQAMGASVAKSQFIANISHELRTPLNAIIGYSEMLIEDHPPGEDMYLYQDLRKIRSSAHQLLSLIDDILDLSKIEAGKLQLHLAPMRIDEMLDEVEQTMHPMIRRSENRFVREESGLPISIVSDRDRVHQILLNLISNAAKFTEQGTITLQVRAEERGGQGEDHWLVCSVRDTGIGIPADRLSRLFVPFNQVDPSSTRRYGGTGLGLALTHRFVTLLGGALSVESAPGQGSTFTASIPFTLPSPSSDETEG